MDNSALLVFKFYLYLSFLFLLGRSFVIIISKFSRQKVNINSTIHGLDIQIFYPIIGIFFLGNYLYILNYLLPVKSKFSYLIFLFIFLNFIEPFELKKLREFIITLPFYLIILVSSYDINFHYDAGLYHLNNQYWIRESNIIFGFSNIYGPFGVGSIYEYISAFLWLDSTFMLIHFTNLTFVGLLYTFLFYNLIRNKNKELYASSLLLVIYSIIDNFGYTGGRNGFINIQSIGKQDLPIAVLFLIVSVLLLTSILKKSFTEEELILYSIFSLFIFQLKISGFAIIFFYLVYLYSYLKETGNTFNWLLSKLKFYILLATIWLAKSIIQTGCIIFPLQSSCFSSLGWVNIDYLTNIENVTVNYSNSYYFGDSISDWFQKYFEVPANLAISINFCISVLVIYLISKTFFYNKKSLKKNKIITFLLLISFLFYLRFGPDMRYLSGLMMLGIFCIGIDIKIKKDIPKLLINILIIASLLMVPKLDSYKSINLSTNPSILVPEKPTKKLYNRFAPESGDQCWININCSANLQNYKIDKNNYFTIVTLQE
ncbi:hypothetical protein N9437_03095 [Acidimicrobiia bacterium]|nr:hypothetical protein [Acidimicrobiia bacterium]